MAAEVAVESVLELKLQHLFVVFGVESMVAAARYSIHGNPICFAISARRVAVLLLLWSLSRSYVAAGSKDEARIGIWTANLHRGCAARTSTM